MLARDSSRVGIGGRVRSWPFPDQMGEGVVGEFGVGFVKDDVLLVAYHALGAACCGLLDFMEGAVVACVGGGLRGCCHGHSTRVTGRGAIQWLPSRVTLAWQAKQSPRMMCSSLDSLVGECLPRKATRQTALSQFLRRCSNV